jgi:hypothetical protein
MKGATDREPTAREVTWMIVVKFGFGFLILGLLAWGGCLP